MPVERTLIGEKSLSALVEHLDEIDHDLDEEQAERESLTRWIDPIERRIADIEARASRERAALWTLDSQPVFALQGWTPASEIPQIETYARGRGMVFQADDPTPEESPPTLLENDPRLKVGEGLVSFYMTPGYRLWDPSKVVLFSFTLFFAMILSDAGYGLVLALGLLVFRKRLRGTPGGRRFRVLLMLLASSTIVWGVLVGSYFGLPPKEGGYLARFQILDLNDMPTMMMLSILIGAAHVILANAMDAWRRRPSLSALAPVGWIAVVVGALCLAYGKSKGVYPGLTSAGTAGLIAGFVLIFLFAGADAKTLGSRVATGFISMAKLTNAFGDILSYLRLFALGLASASLAMAFNDLARDAQQNMGGFGILVAIIIIVVGHSLNFVLALVSGFVHGLRLNLIEFFNWGIPEEGIPFRAFAKPEKQAD
jgi:V/A-type H+-transporting ATPase subunit I